LSERKCAKYAQQIRQDARRTKEVIAQNGGKKMKKYTAEEIEKMWSINEQARANFFKNKKPTQDRIIRGDRG